MKRRMKISNGKVILCIGIIHTALTPLFYLEQFQIFAQQYFFKVNDGFMEQQMNYEEFAAFWCLFFGLLLLPLGFLLNSIENKSVPIPKSFALSYLTVVLIGVYMIPYGGMTFLMLPHAAYMLACIFFKYKNRPKKHSPALYPETD